MLRFVSICYAQKQTWRDGGAMAGRRRGDGACADGRLDRVADLAFVATRGRAVAP